MVGPISKERYDLDLVNTTPKHQFFGLWPSAGQPARGCQFTSYEYQRFLKCHNPVCSISAVGSCTDNAAAEVFFGMLIRERVNRRRYCTRAEARSDIFDYIERSHNPRRKRRMEQLGVGEKSLNRPCNRGRTQFMACLNLMQRNSWSSYSYLIWEL